MLLGAVGRGRTCCSAQRLFSSATDQQLRGLVQSGTLYQQALGEAATLDLPLWRRYGDHLHKSLRGAESEGPMSDADAGRIYQLYLPLYFWLRNQLSGKAAGTGALTVGLSCPQGGGKTTLVDYMQELLALELTEEHQPVSCAVVSMDDFYLTNSQQTALAKEHSQNPLLQYRGNFGTHELQLAENTMSQLRSQRTGSIAVPRYNKSAFAGRGDRAAVEEWPLVAAPVDVVLLEGWCLGFEPSASLHTPDLEPVNQLLHQWVPLWKDLDCMIVVELEDTSVVYQWREQAEAAMRDAGKPAMTEEQVVDFIDRYMPAYKQYLPGLYAKATSGDMPRFHFAVDESRMPITK